ncbi:MAG TPA: C4-dicarboxylate transporter DctA [Cyclobacteriaceae bacterium]|nr:C4-dicarboxylate transporter DctA [Cyclobacteriaceae bacterium]
MKKYLKMLYVQVLIGISAGIAVGYFFPEFSPTAKLLSDTFINMIKMVIAPIIFVTMVLGISGMGDFKKVGRVGGKGLLYFELVTTLALAIGLIVANLVQPGRGVQSEGVDTASVAQYATKAKELNWGEFFSHIVPSNVFKAFADGDILQILFFSILFGIGISRMGSSRERLLGFFDTISKALFSMMKIIMKLAPIGAFAGMAYTIGKFGFGALAPLGKLMICVYLTMALFIFVVLNLIARWFGFSLWKLLIYIKNEILIVLGTSSSESVLPNIMEKLELAGCRKSVVGLIIPTGYSFNLDGTTIYLSMALIFIAQAFNIPLSLGQQLTMMGVLMVTSKGAAGVTGGGFITLASTLTAMEVIPVEGLALLIGVDRFMSEARSITNLIGNTVATVIIAKSENEIDLVVYKRLVEKEG